MPAETTPIFSNGFGAVYADRVAFYAKKGWFGGGVLEELPIRHITSVRLETTRKMLFGLILLAIGIACFAAGSGGAIVVGLIFAALGILLLIGWPFVTINTAGGDLRQTSGGVWQKQAAEDFVAAVRKALFDKP